ncbi:MAG TPA: hypothetical protein V6D26_01455 [Stenomitos sp.]
MIKSLQSSLSLTMVVGLAFTVTLPVQANPVPSINGVSLNIPQLPSVTVPLPGTNFSNGSTATATNNNSVVQSNSGGNASNNNSVVQTTSVTASGNNAQTTASNQATASNGSVSSTSSATSSVSGVQSNSSATATSYPTGVNTISTTAVAPAVTVFTPNGVTTTATTSASAATYISAFSVPTSLQVSSQVGQSSTKIRVQNADNSTNGQGSYVVIGVPSRVFPGLGLTLVQSHP